MTGRCRDCRWWGWDWERGDEERDCRLFSDWPHFSPGPQEDLPEPLAMVAPFAGADGGGFWTKGDFGCVQFEASP